MITIENVEVVGLEAAVRGMRNPMNSWDRGDSRHYLQKRTFLVGPKDLDLMGRLREAGADHRKFMRMIAVYMDVTAPLYWWKEFDTYKVGTVANSCSTMHKIAEREFTVDDFSHEHLLTEYAGHVVVDIHGEEFLYSPSYFLEMTCELLNSCRERYIETGDKRYWWQLIQLLPSSYNQRRTVMLNYEVLANIHKSRRHHKLDEWREFCRETERCLPYSELFTGTGSGES